MTLELFPLNNYFSRSLKDHPLLNMQKEMGNLFSELSGSNGSDASNAGAFLTPKLDIHEEDQAFDVAVELPGVDPKDVTLSIKEGLLSIKGEKKYKKEKNKDGQRYVERSYGSFERTLRLPENIKQDDIDANFKSGVLHVMIPKLEVKKPEEKKIEVRGE